MTPERSALLRCRTAARFDARYDLGRRCTDAEAAEEYAARSVRVDPALLLALVEQGLIEWNNGHRLTAAGRAKLDELNAAWRRAAGGVGR